MILYCKCLNVCIESFGGFLTDNNYINDCPMDILNVNVAEMNVIKLTHRIPNLIKEKNLDGTWYSYSCINCNLLLYICKKKEQTTPILVNKSLLNDTALINDLRLSENFSPAFKIVLKPDDSITEDMYHHHLHDVAAVWLRDEARSVEERIKHFTEEQYANLENQRLRALRDDLLINRIIKADQESERTVNINEIVELSEDSSTNNRVKTTRDDQLKEESSGESIQFDLDGFDTPKTSKYIPDPSTSDTTEDEDEGRVHWKRASANIARSLPIPVPQYMQEVNTSSRLKKGSPPVPHDIAASIRELAKSVHGESIFGSTYIS
ncbi:hypothetical protein O3M35_004293 [Rhynocoris fuscipes]|uniref:Uncharacterized protein n=1 Tax=Rhynocoris fuscipes TaxID=488301 RepID=A0AAW1CJD9_9HEMI